MIHKTNKYIYIVGQKFGILKIISFSIKDKKIDLKVFGLPAD